MMRQYRIVLGMRVWMSVIAVGLSGFAQRAAGQEGATSAYVITGVSVVDVEAGKVLPDRTVVIEGEKILRIGGADTAAPASATSIDGHGQFLIPGLFDAHVHYVDPETYGPLFIAHGVTFVRDMAGFTDQILAQ